MKTKHECFYVVLSVIQNQDQCFFLQDEMFTYDEVFDSLYFSPKMTRVLDCLLICLSVSMIFGNFLLHWTALTWIGVIGLIICVSI